MTILIQLTLFLVISEFCIQSNLVNPEFTGYWNKDPRLSNTKVLDLLKYMRENI